jgi:hypothetical protein
MQLVEHRFDSGANPGGLRERSRPRRKWYDGPDLNDVVPAIIRRRRHFQDEVIAAKAVYAEWAEVSFDLMMGTDAGTETEVVVDWIDGGGV